MKVFKLTYRVAFGQGEETTLFLVAYSLEQVWTEYASKWDSYYKWTSITEMMPIEKVLEVKMP